jgi:hypothetical protein
MKLILKASLRGHDLRGENIEIIKMWLKNIVI